MSLPYEFFRTEISNIKARLDSMQIDLEQADVAQFEMKKQLAQLEEQIKRETKNAGKLLKDIYIRLKKLEARR